MAQKGTTNKEPNISTYQHTVVYRFLKKLRLLDQNGLLNVVFIELVMLLMWVLVFLAAILEGVAWPRDSLKIPMIYDIPLFCYLFGTFPLYLFCISLFDIELNRFIRWVAQEKRIDVETDKLQKMLDKLQRYYRNRWFSFLSLLLAMGTLCGWIVPEFTNQEWSWVSYITTGSWERPTVAGGIAVLYMVLFNFVLYSYVFRFFGWIWLLFQLSHFPFRVDPIHPDSCGGFGPLNLVQKVIGYLICGAGIYIVSIVFNNYLFLGASFFRIDHIALTIAFVILAPLLFIFPLCFFRRKLWLAKRDAITWVDTLANDTIGSVRKLLSNTSRSDYENILEATAKLETVDFTESYRKRIIAMRALPFDFKTFKSFLTLAYSPFLSFTIPFLPETFQKVVNFFV